MKTNLILTIIGLGAVDLGLLIAVIAVVAYRSGRDEVLQAEATNADMRYGGSEIEKLTVVFRDAAESIDESTDLGTVAGTPSPVLRYVAARSMSRTADPQPNWDDLSRRPRPFDRLSFAQVLPKDLPLAGAAVADATSPAVFFANLPRDVVPQAATAKIQEPARDLPPATDRKEAEPETEQEAPEVTVEAAAGEPFGVGRIHIRYPKRGPTWHADQPLIVHDRQTRIRYPAFRPVYVTGDEKPSDQLQQLTAYFLFEGSEPLRIRLLTPDTLLINDTSVPVISDQDLHRRLLGQWWEHYISPAAACSEEYQCFRDYLVQMLSRRLTLSLPISRRAARQTSISALEQKFERAVSMLLGIDSLLLAMQDDKTLGSWGRGEAAVLSLPAPLAVRSVRLPFVPTGVRVESLARHVPAECFYVRCRSLQNYLWLRGFVTQWGGSLHEIVSTLSLDYQVRGTLERQLAVRPALARELGLDDVISDMALIGCDMFFRDGAALGVVFQAKDHRKLMAILGRQRQLVLAEVPGAETQTVAVGSRQVSLLSTPDNEVRSFYAIDGDCHLITNSRYIVGRFFEAARGNRSLAKLHEFRYARQQMEAGRKGGSAPVVCCYLSDPFFRKLTSPSYRIEMTRRSRSIAELKQLRLADLAARSEHHHATSVADLVAAGFLPADFGDRPDGSQPLIADGKVLDSLRGKPGVLLPIPDVPVGRATHREVAAYQKFTREYLVEWRAIDPVIATLASEPAASQDLERVFLQILVTPYARQRYAFLARSLPPAATAHVAPLPGDVLSLSAALRSGTGSHHQLRTGIQDSKVPFVMERGQVKPIGDFRGTTFSKHNAYAVVTPQGTQGLQVLQGFADCVLASRLDGLSGTSTAAPPSSSGESANALGFWLAVNSLRIFDWLESFHYANLVEHRRDWTVLARSAIRERILAQTYLKKEARPAQVRLLVADAQRAAVWPYLRAYTYTQARAESASQAGVLNLLTQQLAVDPAEARTLAEDVLRARFVSPVGGSYRLTKGESDLEHWTGSAWPQASLYQEREVPPEYRFPFLDWLRGLDAEFSLTGDTLKANVTLTVKSSIKSVH